MSTLREQFAAYDKRPRVWLDSDGNEDWAFCFYDWFCKDSALENRAKKLMPTAKKFARRMNIDLDTHYVFFKNNCPFSGPLRDDFRICNKETGDVVWLSIAFIVYEVMKYFVFGVFLPFIQI